MAELIDKGVTSKLIYNFFDSLIPSHYYKLDLVKANDCLQEEINKLPTVTEAEDIPIIHGKAELELHDKGIRAKAISDFLQFVYDNASNEEYANEDGWAMSDLIDLEFKFAEQLKEHSRKLNRCDTCTHYVADEVPPICYFCCKGIEDNYEQKGE
jgi:hypothetical protein